MTSIAQQKQQLRQQVRLLKKQFSSDELVIKSTSALQKLENNPLFQAASHIMLYFPLPDEVDLRPVIQKYVNQKVVILPTVVGDDIVPVQLTPSDQLKEGAFNIMEPDSEPYTGEFDLIVVPGMGFDNLGHRLGRGKGFYDRFLAQYPQVPTIGICFDFQLFPAIPTDSFDKPVSQLITT